MSREISTNLTPILLTPEQAAVVLGISQSAFYRHAPKIIARHGLTPITVGKSKKYSYTQLRKIIAKCATSGEPLFEF